MLQTRIIYRGALICLGALCSLQQARTQELFLYSNSNTPAIRTELKGGEMVGEEQVQRAYLTVGTNVVVFRMPPGCQMDASNPERVIVSDLTHNCFIGLSYVKPAIDASAGSADAYYRSLSLSRFPTATISGESSEFAADHSGPSFDLVWKNSGGAAQSARVAFILLPAGVLQIELVAGMENFDHGATLLRILLASMRTNEHGKIEIKPLPDNS